MHEAEQQFALLGDRYPPADQRRKREKPCRMVGTEEFLSSVAATLHDAVADATTHSSRSVAQPGSASVWGTEGRGFESRRSDQILTHPRRP